MSRIPQFEIAILVSLIFNQSAIAEQRTKKESAQSPEIPVVKLFDGLKDGHLSVKLVQESEKRGVLFLANKTQQPLSVQMPEAFVGVHVLNERIARIGPSVRDEPQRGQSTGAGVSGDPKDRRRADRNDEAARRIPIAARQRLKLPITSVCLEYGRPTPNSKMNYRIMSVEQFARRNPVLRELIPLFVQTRINQRIAQAAAWHVSNKLSWRDLSRLQNPIVVGLPGGPIFKAEDLNVAKELVDRATERAAKRKPATDGSPENPANEAPGRDRKRRRDR